MSIIDSIKKMFGGECECETKDGCCVKGDACCKANETSEVKTETPAAPIVETPAAPIVEAPAAPIAPAPQAPVTPETPQTPQQ